MTMLFVDAASGKWAVGHRHGPRLHEGPARHRREVGSMAERDLKACQVCCHQPVRAGEPHPRRDFSGVQFSWAANALSVNRSTTVRLQ